jgi:hypothetical protein
LTSAADAVVDAKVVCGFGLAVTWLRYLVYAWECLAEVGEAGGHEVRGRVAAKWEMLDVLAESWAWCGLGADMQPPARVIGKLPRFREHLLKSQAGT